MVYSTGNAVIDTIGLNDAGIPRTVIKTVTGPDGPRVLNYEYTLDEVLRTTATTLTYEGKTTVLERLVYNNNDQVEQKLIGGTPTGFLQTVDYTYDGAGKLLTINQPLETACISEEEICQLYWGNVESNIDLEDQNCGLLLGVELDGTYYTAPSPIDITATEVIESFINERIAEEEKVGAAEVFYENYLGLNEDFHISIMHTNIETASLVFKSCRYDLEMKACCEIPLVGQDGNFPLPDSPERPDLFFESITYDGLDISNIEMIGSCSAGLIKNTYAYDADHRLMKTTNQLFTPQLIGDAFTSSYTYDAAGNIQTLKRNGWVQEDEHFTLIDDLKYTYEENNIGLVTSKLQKVEDQLAGIDDVAQVKGFGALDPISEYSYDGNGNLNADSGKKIDAIAYNLLNLPSEVAHETEGSMSFEYTFGGEKIKKVTKDGTRDYIGGLEFMGGGLELIHIPNGRITEKAGQKKYQYQLTDHLGNIVVVFEDVNDDGKISIEEDPDNPENEIIQRNYYYSFGLRVDAPQFALSAEPQVAYEYNGKENHEELGLNWLSFKFRWYDPAIGRFPSVDPIADNFAHVSGFNYAENEPIGHIDLWGLQAVTRHDVDLDPGLTSINATQEERSYYNQIVLKGTVAGASVIGLGYTAGQAAYWMATNPATTLEVIQSTGIAVAEGLTEQQIAGAALALKVGDELIDLAPGYSNWFQRIMWGQYTGKAMKPTVKNGKLLLGNEKTANGVADFIISEEGELILGSGHHYMSSRSKSVIAAGEVLVEDGVLKTVNNQSGHYQPSEAMLSKFLDYFKELGVDVSKATTTTEKLSQ